MIRRPPRSTRTEHSFPTRRSSDLKGDVLFQLDARPYQAEVDRLVANQAQARAELNLAETNQRRSEEHTSELQSLMRTSYAVFCLKKKKDEQTNANKQILIEESSQNK